MRTIPIVAVALAFVAGVALAEHPECTTDEATLEAGGFYVVSDPCAPPDCLFSIWIYQETNGQEGLQRGDQICSDGHDCGYCESDTIIF